MKILILALSGIGDALMFTPALKLLRKSLPDAGIDALVMFKGVKDMFERNPDFNNVYYFDFLNRGVLSSLRYLITLRNEYDSSLNVYPSNRKEYNIINFLIGSSKRAGVKYLRGNLRQLGFLNNVNVGENDSSHNVQTNIKLVEKLLNKNFNEEPPLNFSLSREDELFALDFLNKMNIEDSDTVIGFHPGSAIFKNHIHRRWEPEKFAALAKNLIESRNAKIFLFGGPDEEELKQKIAGLINSKNVIAAGIDNLPRSAAVIKRCNVFVTNDSGLMHVAASMGIKVVAIIGPTNPAYIHPWKTEHKIVTLNLDCSPCFIYSPRPLICLRDDIKFKCIKEINVEMVYNIVNSMI